MAHDQCLCHTAQHSLSVQCLPLSTTPLEKCSLTLQSEVGFQSLQSNLKLKFSWLSKHRAALVSVFQNSPQRGCPGYKDSTDEHAAAAVTDEHAAAAVQHYDNDCGACDYC